MLRNLKRWLVRRRFERLFVRPFEAQASLARKAHRAGVRETQKAKQEFLHAALRGRS